jgi:anti-anti-sigma factor
MRPVTGDLADQAVRVAVTGEVAVVTPPAAVDALNSLVLRHALLVALAEHATVVADMTANEFCDSTGLQALMIAHRSGAGGELRVAVDHTQLRRIFKLTGVNKVLRIFHTVADAISAPPADIPAADG